jgi:16S rRNA (uracil1498-N3)-methyltransferase
MRADGEERKNERRARIAAEAAKQCGRSVLPTVGRTVGYAEMLRMACERELCLFCYEGEGTRPLGQILRSFDEKRPESISIVIGSEGGFSIAEAEAARRAGVQMTGLGKRILRTETASSFVLACLVCATELQD